MVALAMLIDTMPVEQAGAALLPFQRASGGQPRSNQSLAINIGAAHGISEERLRALDVLKSSWVAQPSLSKKRPPGRVALANGYQHVAAMLRVQRDRQPIPDQFSLRS
jgi:hypothetical protein